MAISGDSSDFPSNSGTSGYNMWNLQGLGPLPNCQSKKPGGLADDAAAALSAAVWAVESVEEHHTNKNGTYYTHWGVCNSSLTHMHCIC